MSMLLIELLKQFKYHREQEQILLDKLLALSDEQLLFLRPENIELAQVVRIELKKFRSQQALILSILDRLTVASS